LQIKTKIVSSHTADSKPVKQEVNSAVILPPLVFPAIGICDIDLSTGLSVPDEDDDGGPVEFRIGEKTFRNPFESGKLFVVDDSFETELRNRSKRNLVLML